MLSQHCQPGSKHLMNCWTCLLQKLSQKKKKMASLSDIVTEMVRVFRKLSVQKVLQCVFGMFRGATEYMLGFIPLCGSIIGLHYLRGCCRWVVKGGATSNAIAANVRIVTCKLPGWERLAFFNLVLCDASPVGAWHVLWREKERESAEKLY